jgi:hypothetical protein
VRNSTANFLDSGAIVLHYRRVSWFFHKSQVVAAAEPEPSPTDTLAHAEAECIFAESAWDVAVSALRHYNVEHAQMPFSYTTGEVTRVVTMVNDFERLRLEKAVRAALDRRNTSLSERADLMMRMGLIR